MILSKYLFLDDKQKEKLDTWLESLPEPPYDTETCTFEGQEFSFKGYETGIGEVLYVETRIDNTIFRCYLAYDDNGELT